ncbi:hypothetical protein GGX14DRAFT_553497 [Mycena pura]|uniref:Uncharacterized protein n=1 Tax=Mycena pura TaxID=153505 RepID=A0AAD7E5D3_9AGAR|nr:hypothetical protein GGX14DRAFT_553497 [Mycena pura]
MSQQSQRRVDIFSASSLLAHSIQYPLVLTLQYPCNDRRPCTASLVATVELHSERPAVVAFVAQKLIQGSSFHIYNYSFDGKRMGSAIKTQQCCTNLPFTFETDAKTGKVFFCKTVGDATWYELPPGQGALNGQPPFVVQAALATQVSNQPFVPPGGPSKPIQHTLKDYDVSIRPVPGPSTAIPVDPTPPKQIDAEPLPKNNVDRRCRLISTQPIVHVKAQCVSPNN